MGNETTTIAGSYTKAQAKAHDAKLAAATNALRAAMDREDHASNDIHRAAATPASASVPDTYSHAGKPDMPHRTPKLADDQIAEHLRRADLDPADWDVAGIAARTNSWIADYRAMGLI